jgi:hypothetical protein
MLGLVKAVDQRLNAIQEVTISGETCAVSPWAKLDRTITGPRDTKSERFST